MLYIITLPEHVAMTWNPIFNLSRRSFGKLRIVIDKGQIDLPENSNISAPSQQKFKPIKTTQGFIKAKNDFHVDPL